MDRLIEVIDIIDTELKGFYFKDMRFFGLTSLIQRGEKTIPAAYGGFGQYEFAFMGIYHRVLGEDNEENLDEGFGRSPLSTETYDMKMVVQGDQRKIDDTNVDINPRIADDLFNLFPVRLTGVQSTSLSVQSVTILKGAKNFNKQELWAEEMAGNPFKLKPESLYFSMNYQIKIDAL